MPRDKALVTVYGRNRFSDGATTVVTIEDIYRENVLFEIYGANINERSHSNEFVVESLHENGTDFEHDSAKVINLMGAGLKYDGMSGRNVYFTGVLLEASFYPPDFKLAPGAETPHSGDHPTITTCDEGDRCTSDEAGHLIMPYTPPKQKFNARPVRITLRMQATS